MHAKNYEKAIPILMPWTMNTRDIDYLMDNIPEELQSNSFPILNIRLLGSNKSTSPPYSYSNESGTLIN
jgi:hypothetical protein